MSANNVFRIGKYVLAPIFGEWLPITDFCRLDSSFCSKSFRGEFLSTVAGQVFSAEIEGKADSLCVNLLDWTSNKELFLKDFILNMTTFRKLLATCTDKMTLSARFAKLVKLKKLTIDYLAQSTRDYGKELLQILFQNSQLLTLELIQTPLNFLIPAIKEYFETQSVDPSNNWTQSITSLNLSRCGNWPDSPIDYLLSLCPKITSLNFDQANYFTDKALSDVAHNCPQLLVLKMPNCTSHELNLGLQEIAKCCPLLQVLDVTESRNINDEAICSIVESCPDLRELYMNITSVTDKSVMKIVEKKTPLCAIGVGNQTMVSETALVELLKTCTQITHVNLKGFTTLTKNTADVLVSHGAEKLQHLNLQWCISMAPYVPQITTACISLVYLNLSDVFHNVNYNQPVEMFTTRQNHLKTLILDRYQPIGDASLEPNMLLQSVVEHCFELTTLSLVSNTCIGTHSLLPTVVAQNPLLQSLVISGCPHLTNDDVALIRKVASPQLKHINIYYCPNAATVGPVPQLW